MEVGVCDYTLVGDKRKRNAIGRETGIRTGIPAWLGNCGVLATFQLEDGMYSGGITTNGN